MWYIVTPESPVQVILQPTYLVYFLIELCFCSHILIPESLLEVYLKSISLSHFNILTVYFKNKKHFSLYTILGGYVFESYPRNLNQTKILNYVFKWC